MGVNLKEQGGIMTARDNPEIPVDIQSTTKKDVIGPAAFILMTVAVLLFFWWLLIYDHGVVSVH